MSVYLSFPLSLDIMNHAAMSGHWETLPLFLLGIVLGVEFLGHLGTPLISRAPAANNIPVCSTVEHAPRKALSRFLLQ